MKELTIYDKALARAERKLERINARAGRNYSEDGYGDEYLRILIDEAIHEMAMSEYCERNYGKRSFVGTASEPGTLKARDSTKHGRISNDDISA